MPLRGESVGTAYIRLIADGTGIPDDIRKSLDDADGKFADAGSRDAKAYKKALAEEIEKHDDHALRDAFNKALVMDDAIDDFFTSQRWRNTEQNFRARFGGLGQAAADEIRNKFIHNGSLDGIEADIEAVSRRVNEIADRAISENNRVTSERAKAAEDFERRFRAAMEESAEVSRRVSRDNVSNLEGLRRILERLRTTTLTGFTRELEKARIELGDASHDLERRGSAFSRFAVTIDHIADGVGAAFGRGSRNDLLNFTGSFIRNFVSLIGLPARLVGNLGELREGFTLARASGEGFFTAIKSGFSSMAADAEGGSTALSSLVSSGIVSLPLLAVALTGIVAVLGVVSALISGIVAALIALVSTISFGIVGALAPLVGLLAPIALGVGTIVLGIKTMDDASKKALTNAIKPLTNGLKDLGKTAREGFLSTFDRDLPAIATKLDRLDPLVRGIGKAFGVVGNEIVDSLDSPTLRRFINLMTVFAPQAIESLARSFGNLGGAFTAIFSDLIPTTRDFLGFLEKITGEFKDFVTQNPGKVVAFFKTAADAAKTLGRFLGSVVDLLGTLLGQGLETGNSIFDSLTKNIEKFTDSIRPKHQPTVFDEATSRMGNFKDSLAKIPPKNPLEDFFKNGKQTADDIGNIAVSLGKIADSLDNPETRQLLHDLLGIANALTLILPNLTPFISLWSNFSDITKSLKSTLGPVAGFIESAAHSVRNFARDFDDLQNKLTFKGGIDLGGKIKKLFSFSGGGPGGFSPLTIQPPSLAWIPGTLSRLRTFGQQAAGPYVTLENRVNSVFGGFGGIASRAAQAVVTAMGSLPVRLGNLTSRIGGAGVRWGNAIVTGLVDVPGRILGLFAGLGQAIIRVIGDIHIPVHIDVPDKAKPFLGPLGLLTASGGIFDGAQFRVIGEKGAEAVVPLTGPLNQVDPSVRWLSQIARGMSPTTSAPATGSGKTINNEWNITQNGTDPVAAANELLNRMVATAY